VTVVCSACGATLDAQDPDLALIAAWEGKRGTIQPPIPLGARGRFKGASFEVVGYLVREYEADGQPYFWTEYLLFNPHKGFRWLTEGSGHWVLAHAVRGRPEAADGGAVYLGTRYRHYQTMMARVRVVLGEFPWRVRVGEQTVVSDFVAPPAILSREQGEQEVTWSVGEHLDGRLVWEAFGLPGAPPERQGVGPAQPSPWWRELGPTATAFGALAVAAALLHLLALALCQNRTVLERWFEYDRRGGPTSMVTEPFELTGRPSNVKVEIFTDLANNWAYFNLALVREHGGGAIEVGREVSYYRGRDSDGPWTEGAPADEVYVPRVPAGHYRLIVMPEPSTPRMRYAIRIRRDVPRHAYLWGALGLLAVPVVAIVALGARFEWKRWQESDHPWVTSTDGEDDD
jgi:hypothetical protein